jgi:ABC-type transport system substrate-binding protein
MNHRGGEEKPDEGTETSNASHRTRSGQRSCELVARLTALAAAFAVALLAVSGAGGADAQTPKRGGTVVVAYSQEPACLNPLLHACFFLPGARVLPGAFDVRPDLTYRPNLVSTVDMVSTRPQTLVYHIRPQARWSDGQPLTARDFRFTFRAFTDPKLPLTAGAGDFGEMRRVEVVNSKTLKVVLRNRDPEYRRLFPLVLPRHALVGADLSAIWRDGVDDPGTGKPIGSGPFLIAGFDRARQLNLVRNPRYWGSHTAYLDRLVYRFVSPDELVERFQNGQADVLSGSSTSADAFLALRKEHPPGMRFFSFPGRSWEHFEINTGARGHPALQKRLVRQALAYGIDRDAIARRVMGGLYGEPRATSQPLQSVVFLATSPYYEPNWEAYRYRPGVARRLLKRAGCRLGTDGIYECSGKRLSLRFVTTAGVGRRELAVTLVQSQLRTIGVEVLPVFIPSGTLLGCETDCVLVRGDFDVALFAWVGSSQLLSAAYSLVCQFGGNFSGYCDRLITRDLNQIWGILDLTRRVQRLNGIDARLARAVPWIPLFQVPYFVALRRSVEGVVINPGDPTWNAENWWLDR